jgi:predicted transposase YbfD/YdcC
MVSAWSSAQRLVLAQVKVEDKTNEITAIPDLLEMLMIKGCIVTIDAMGCQKKIAEKIIVAEGDYILALKGNQGRLHDSVKLAFDGATPDVLTGRCQDHSTTTDGDHGRIETRQAWVVTDIDWLEEKKEWCGLRSLGIVDSTVEAAGKVTQERRYFISSLLCSAKDFSAAVRNHWGVESALHWTLDVTFREDASRIRKGHAPENFAMLRHIALNLLQSTKTKRLSIKTKRLRAGWDNDYLMQVLLGAKISKI